MVLFVGSTVLDRTMIVERREGDVLRVSRRYASPGGNAINSAFFHHALGGDTALLTAWGQDAASLPLRQALHEEGIEHVAYDLDQTKVADIALYPDGTRDIFIDNFPQPEIVPNSESRSLVERADTVDFRPTMLEDRISEWYDMCRDKRRALAGIHLEKELCSGRTWHVVTESALLIEKPGPDVLHSIGADIFVLTDGARGGEWWSPDGGWRSYRSFAPGSGGDHTGAGDAFRAGLLFALDRGLDHEKAIEIAARSGAKALSYLGGIVRSQDFLGLD